MIFLSAGHDKKDPGAVANGYKESELASELRGLIESEIKIIGGSVIIDDDTERLSEYIKRIKPGTGSVVCEIHFNAGPSNATGTETLVKNKAKQQEIELADSVNKIITKHTGLLNRGVKTESQSQHSRLAILNTGAGISILPEICFISNKTDIQKYNKSKNQIAKDIAKILVLYDSKAS